MFPVNYSIPELEDEESYLKPLPKLLESSGYSKVNPTYVKDYETAYTEKISAVHLPAGENHNHRSTMHQHEDSESVNLQLDNSKNG